MNNNRIMIVGLPGAGKSTFGIQLSEVLAIPYYSIDRYYWQANWQKPDPQEWLTIHKKLIDNEEWIIEGCAIQSSFMQRFARADCVIYFKFPKILCLWRMIKRCCGIKKTESLHRPDNCRDTLPWRLISYMWTFDKDRMRDRLIEAQILYPKVKVYIVKNDRDAQDLLKILILNRKNL